MIDAAVGLPEAFPGLVPGLLEVTPAQPASADAASRIVKNVVIWLAQADRRTRKPPWNSPHPVPSGLVAGWTKIITRRTNQCDATPDVLRLGIASAIYIWPGGQLWAIVLAHH